MGIEAFRYYAFDGMEIWVKPLANNELAVCFLNRTSQQKTINYDWKEHLITDSFSKLSVDFNQVAYKLFDVWTKKEAGATGKPFRQVIGANDVVVLKLIKQ